MLARQLNKSDREILDEHEEIQDRSKVDPERSNGRGNTKPCRSQTTMAKHWCFTYNNYTEDEIRSIDLQLREKCKKFVFQEEKGESGTPHLQGYLELTKKQRWNTILPELKKIHWEICRDINCAIDYCQKDDTRVGKIYKWGFPKPLKIITELKPWQKEIDDLLKTEPDDRKIYWYYDTVGNIGKSAFTKYCFVKYNSLFIDEGKKSDIMNMVFNYIEKNEELKSVIIDVPRDNGNLISYKSIESIKNGLIANTKYETGAVAFNTPHVIVFANCPPDYSRFSSDRWVVKDLTDYKYSYDKE